MKTEDIDKRINMPNIDAEWARFKKDVIEHNSNIIMLNNKKKKIMSKKIAAILILAVCFGGAVLASVYHEMVQDEKELTIDTNVETKPLVVFKDQLGRHRNVYLVNLCPGTWVKNSDGNEHIEEEFMNYSFVAPGGKLTMQLDGVPFDKDNLPKLTNKDLKKIESSKSNNDLTVNLITTVTKVPTSVLGNFPRVMTILLPGNGEIYMTKYKAQEGNWMNCSVTSWEKSWFGWGVEDEFKRVVQKVKGLQVYIYSSTEANQKDIDRATAMLKKVGVNNISYKKNLPIKHFSDTELRQWAQKEKSIGTPYDKLYDKMAPQGMPVPDVHKQWRIVKSVYGIKK